MGPLGVLAGIRVVDLTDETGAFATRLLADLGAEVVRVEPPEGSRLRSRAPRYRQLYLDAGKRSVVLDRTSPDGAAAFARLLASAGAVVETERLDPDEVRAAHPGIVHVTITPFGLDGPWTHWRGNDLIASAASGLAWVCGKPGDPPNQPGGDQAANMTGLVAACGTVFALHAGVATHLDISMQTAAAMSTVQTSSPHHLFWYGTVPKRPGLTAVHQCSDGQWATVMVRPDRLAAFLSWCDELGIEVHDDPKLLRHPVKGVIPLARLIRQVAARYTRDELYEQVWGRGMLGLPVHTLPDLDRNEHLQAIGTFVDVEQADGSVARFPRSPLHHVAVPLRRAPALGENAEVVDVAAAVVGTAPPANGTHGTGLLGALAGVRVVDFCWVLAGPYGTRLLANFGAEVIRVEPGGGRADDAFPIGRVAAELGTTHNSVNTHKRSVTIDPTTARGRELLLDVIAQADIVTNNYRPGAFEEMGFGYEVLRARNPGIISIHMPGCGREGPWRDRGSYGNMVAAASGVSWLTGFPGRSPRGMGVAYPDFTGPYLLAMTAVAALRRRAVTGVGEELEVNQLTGAIALIGTEWLEYDATGVPPPMRANRDPAWCPHGIYPAAGDDEWVAIAGDGDRDWRALAACAGFDPGDARFATHADRKAHEDELDSMIGGWTAGFDKYDLAERVQQAGVAAAPVVNVRDAVERDPYLSRWIERVRQPTHPDVEIPIPGEAIQEAGRHRTLRPAPLVGADNDYVLTELLGLDAETVDNLYANGAIWA